MIDETAASTSSTTAEQQLDWLLDASSRGPLPDGEIRQHLVPALLEASGGPDGFNAALAAVGPLTLRETLTTQPDQVQAAVHAHTTGYRITVHVEAAGRVDNLRLTPDEPEPTSWTEIDARLAEPGARVSWRASRSGTANRGCCHIR
ncbi:Cpe/LpqF family protein [Nonomuraea sp. JJY05]|uniref:Cpe/LpqF family protein n=1 Tax=Nonomuraea sp. JJY05 TaxID=3350255 RepID=UPI00373F94FD